MSSLCFWPETVVQEGVQNSWSLIATKLPGRTNKDCRKRWLKVCKDVNKGVWTADEDERLRRGIETYGQRFVFFFFPRHQVVGRAKCDLSEEQEQCG